MRGAWLGVLSHLCVVAVVAVRNGGKIPPELLRWSLAGSIGTLSICVALAFVDIRRRGERALVGNLGLSDHELVANYVAGAALVELVFAILTAW
jgi:hypothetical protein